MAFDPPAPPNPCVVCLEVVGPRLCVSLAACIDREISVSPAVVTINLLVTACPDVLYGRVGALFVGLRRLFTVISSECLSFPPPVLTLASRRGPGLVFQTDSGFSKYLRASSNYYGTQVHQHLDPTMEDIRVCAGWRKFECKPPRQTNGCLQSMLQPRSAQLSSKLFEIS